MDTDEHAVKVTRALLEAKQDSLSKEQAEAVDRYKHKLEMKQKEMDEVNARIRQLCPILCSGIEKSMIPSPGWIYPVERLCYALEVRNLEFKKYGIYVNVSQTKSKLGGLRFYYDVNVKPSMLFSMIVSPFSYAENLMKSASLKKHKILSKIFRALAKFKYTFLSYEPEMSNSRKLMLQAFEDYVEDRVRQCEDECYCLCENCGSSIKEDRCTTHGWIAYLCEECAVADGGIYSKDNGMFFKEGKKTKSPYKKV